MYWQVELMQNEVARERFIVKRESEEEAIKAVKPYLRHLKPYALVAYDLEDLIDEDGVNILD